MRSSLRALAPTARAELIARLSPEAALALSRDWEVVLAREWRGVPGTPLDPDVVMGDVAALVAPYRVGTLHTDQWSADVLRVVARQHGLVLFDRA